MGVDLPKPKAAFSNYARLVTALMTERDRPRLFQDAPFDMVPATDDNPFYFVERARPGQRAGTGVLELQTLVIALIVLIVPFLLVPLIPTLRRTGHAAQRPSTILAALAYFSLIGVAFMGVEIELFHVFALLLGSPVVTSQSCSRACSSAAGSAATCLVESIEPADGR